MVKKLPSSEYLNDMFIYNPETGDLFKKPFIDSMGRTVTRFSKAPIRNILLNHGGKRYYRTTLTGERNEVLVHRIIFKMVYGVEPESIDHINGNGLDNRLCNIRQCTHSENHRNRRISTSNSSGVVGVSRTHDGLRWRVRIRAGKRDIQLGEFKSFNDAVNVRRQAEIDYNYHENNGKVRPL